MELTAEELLSLPTATAFIDEALALEPDANASTPEALDA